MIKILELFGDLKVKVHSDGTIETMDHVNVRKNGRVDNRKGRVLKPTINRYGYQQVTFSHKGIRKTYAVHRLVAQAFILNPHNKPTVNHINGIKTDNHFRNLEWSDLKEQKEHSIRTGLCEKNIRALESSNKRRSKQVTFRGKTYDSIRSAARNNSVHERVVKREGVIA